MRLQFMRRRHVDHCRKHHEGVGAEILGLSREGRGTRGRHLRHADDDRDASVARRDGGAENIKLLVGIERVVLAACSQHHQPVHAIAYERVERALRRLEIKRKVGPELRRRRRKDTGPFHRDRPRSQDGRAMNRI